MKLEDLIERTGAWISDSGASGIIVSSRVRLARNLAHVAFPGWAGKEERRRVAQRVRHALEGLDVFAEALHLDVTTLDPVDSLILQERHLISAHLASRAEGGGVVVSPDESVAVMINEEDHLRMQALRPGLALDAAWKDLDAVDSALEAHLPYAFSERLGYITACPSNVGTGMRASVMAHLPALRLLDEIEAVIRGLRKIGLAVRGSFGEGTEAWGNMFQISNQMTLGESEGETVERITQVALEVAQHEQNARERLQAEPLPRLEDHVGRALGVIRGSRMISTREAMDRLSALRLGVDLGLMEGIESEAVQRLIVLTQPGHLQRILQKTSGHNERDVQRSDVIRRHVRDVRISKESQ